jgi:hypothetical protein
MNKQMKIHIRACEKCGKSIIACLHQKNHELIYIDVDSVEAGYTFQYNERRVIESYSGKKHVCEMIIVFETESDNKGRRQ